MKKLIRPKKLQKGDTIAAISLSWGGPGTIPSKYNYGVRQLENLLDVKVKPTRQALKDAQWLHDNPKARADDLMEAFLDPDIKAIISTIGGSDSIRLLPYIDLDVIAQNPKIFMGYSDTTISHFACYKAGLSSFYGPSIMAGFGENGGLHPYMAQAVKKMLCNSAAPGIWEPDTSGWVSEQHSWDDTTYLDIPRPLNNPVQPLYLQGDAKVKGRLIGGCLEVLEFLKGTDYWPNLNEWEGCVLFIETSEEAPSPEFLIRVLRNYAAQGILQRLSGVLFGRPGGLKTNEKFKSYDDALLQVITKECSLDNLHIVTHLAFGHTDPMHVLPYGAMVEIDSSSETITFTEGAVL
jgi:muramoyltetrapeptide carboxypeptidase LdcA involved in peptidoglycan recycling